MAAEPSRKRVRRGTVAGKVSPPDWGGDTAQRIRIGMARDSVSPTEIKPRWAATPHLVPADAQ